MYRTKKIAEKTKKTVYPSQVCEAEWWQGFVEKVTRLLVATVSE